MADIEKVIKGLEHCISEGDCRGCPYFKEILDSKIICPCREDALALLKEQDAVVKQWTKEIADMQLAHAPNDYHGFMSLDEYLENKYKKGIWDGLQIAWNIISEGR